MATRKEPTAYVGDPIKTAAKRKEQAKKYIETARDALRVADAHLSAVHSSAAAEAQGEIQRHVRELRHVARMVG